MKRNMLKLLNLKNILFHFKRYVWLLIKIIINAKGWIVINNPRNSENTKIFNLIDGIKKESKNALSDFEFLHLHTLIKKTEKIAGDVAEVGVFKGGSAKIICETTKKQVHLFDTFAGLPEISAEDTGTQFKKGEYYASLDEVKDYLKNYSNALFYKGLFPSTSHPIEDKKFSLVHLDVDIYESTLDCLKFFYPRISKGGVIISHDYTCAKGVKKAFDEFFKDKPEIIIDSIIASSQCFIIKV
jgi:O-methyltransferase